MTLPSLIQHSVIGIALVTAAGVLIHDTKIDQFTVTALTLPAMLATFEAGKTAHLSTSDHTHVERVTFAEKVPLGTPRVVPPRSDRRTHVLPQKVSKGNHNFDGYYLPQYA